MIVAAAGHWTASGVVQREVEVGRDLRRPLIWSPAPSRTGVKDDRLGCSGLCPVEEVFSPLLMHHLTLTDIPQLLGRPQVMKANVAQI